MIQNVMTNLDILIKNTGKVIQTNSHLTGQMRQVIEALSIFPHVLENSKSGSECCRKLNGKVDRIDESVQRIESALKRR